MRLIDVDRLLPIFQEIYNNAYADYFKSGSNSFWKGCFSVMSEVIRVTDKQPSAYDIDKVIVQLNKASDYYECEQQGREHVAMVDLSDAIEIVGGELMDRDCNNCIHHSSGGCSQWDCKFKLATSADKIVDSVSDVGVRDKNDKRRDS